MKKNSLFVVIICLLFMLSINKNAYASDVVTYYEGLEIEVSDKEAGDVSIISDSENDDYNYGNRRIILKAVPKSGYRFVCWNYDENIYLDEGFSDSDQTISFSYFMGYGTYISAYFEKIEVIKDVDISKKTKFSIGGKKTVVVKGFEYDKSIEILRKGESRDINKQTFFIKGYNSYNKKNIYVHSKALSHSLSGKSCNCGAKLLKQTVKVASGKKYIRLKKHGNSYDIKGKKEGTATLIITAKIKTIDSGLNSKVVNVNGEKIRYKYVTPGKTITIKKKVKVKVKPDTIDELVLRDDGPNNSIKLTVNNLTKNPIIIIKDKAFAESYVTEYVKNALGFWVWDYEGIKRDNFIFQNDIVIKPGEKKNVYFKCKNIDAPSGKLIFYYKWKGSNKIRKYEPY